MASHDLPSHPDLAARSLAWLPAEASARRYARLVAPRGAPAPSAVLMLFASGTRPAEVRRVARATERLGAAGIPVPQLFRVNLEQGWILQEDLGDVSLAGARSRGDNVAPAYSEAVALLDRLRPLTLDTSPRPPLDRRRMREELHQFATRGLGLHEGPGPALAAELDALAEACAALPVVLCHRDYHARNLMLHEGRLRVLDHQDALPGPLPYDRVSLAYDPYVALPDAIRDRIAGDAEGTSTVAVQRLAKAIGTYGDKGGPWRRWIAPAARSARRMIKRDTLPFPMLDLAFASLAVEPPAAAAGA